MAVPSSFIKHSYEKYPIDIDFTQLISLGETIVTAQVEAYTGSTLVTDTIIDNHDIINDTTNGYYAVRIIVQGGTNTTNYKIEIKIITSSGNRLQENIYMNVNDG